MARSLSSDARAHTIDTAKAIGIVLVVVGHTPGTPAGLVPFIYTFHMPLFFFLSGYLLSPQRAGAPWREALVRNTRSLLVPYAFFFAVSLAYWLMTRGVGDRAARYAGLGLSDALYGFATGLSSDLFVNPPLWFFTCLFVCVLLHAAWRQRLSAWQVALVSILPAIAVLAWQGDARLPWGLDIAWVALLFYSAGHALRFRGITFTAKRAFLWPALILTVGLTWLVAGVNGRVDLAEMNFGIYPSLYLPGAAFGIAMVLLAAHFCPPTALARWLSDNSLVIFPLHALTFSLGSGFIKVGWPNLAANGYGAAWCLPFVAWSLAAVFPVAWLLTRHAPQLLGRAQVRRGESNR
jgi:acyltransferase